MLTQATKLDHGWLIKDLPSFDDIKQNVITVDVQLSSADFLNLDYKELRGVAIMERYFEKQQREDFSSVDNNDCRSLFRKEFGIAFERFSTALKEL